MSKMSKRDMDLAEDIKTILGWRSWRQGFDGYVCGQRGSRTEIVTIQSVPAAIVIKRLAHVVATRKKKK